MHPDNEFSDEVNELAAKHWISGLCERLSWVSFLESKANGGKEVLYDAPEYRE